MTDPTDEVLAGRARGGDRAAFEALVRRHKSGLYAFVRRYMGSADDAYDALQETFVAAWLALGRYDPARPFLPWMRTIALNKCRDAARRLKVRRLLARAFRFEQQGNDSTEMLDRAREEDAAQAERLAELDRAVAALPALYKEPLLLTLVSGLSHKEAAEQLGTTAKAIEMRLARGRRALQAMLEKSRRDGGDRRVSGSNEP